MNKKNETLLSSLPILSIIVFSFAAFAIPGFFHDKDYMGLGIFFIIANGSIWGYSLVNLFSLNIKIKNVFLRVVVELIIFIAVFILGAIFQSVIYGGMSK